MYIVFCITGVPASSPINPSFYGPEQDLEVNPASEVIGATHIEMVTHFKNRQYISIQLSEKD